ncbi:MAG: C4-dicarboxylate transporter [Amycolatopsis sp.]|uniref:TDT family transporter n=1 Tax=Amycolatopsis sp. TaxID=37632 RepID=UPI002601F54A|nr:TDT family transporter [Amycolatopsis sp.]MCU1681095.1 C4-dicarboxylate transporter [Amycolatopsis sp.]
MLKSAPRSARLELTTAPNWFSSVMGTGIVANAAASLPLQFPGLRTAATVVWLLATVWLMTLCVRLARGWWTDRATVRGYSIDPVTAQFWGALPMAVLTVGAGTLGLGRDWIGLAPAVAADWTLWTIGTALGLLTTAAVPYLMMTGRIKAAGASPTWLMPVVPPMVSASTGAALIAHLPAGQAKLTMLMVCYGLFGISLFATLVLLPQIWSQLVRHGVGPAAGVPTLWIVLGALGQSTTATNLLGDAAKGVLPAPYDTAAKAFGLLYGVPTWSFAMLWLVLAALVTLRTRPPFSLAWWAFTFPLGTCVTGACALAARTGATVFTIAAVTLFVLLVTLWVSVARSTGSRLL